jgi:hypothetical protein
MAQDERGGPKQEYHMLLGWRVRVTVRSVGQSSDFPGRPATRAGVRWGAGNLPVANGL